MVTEVDTGRLAEITLRLVWAGADLHQLDFLRWLAHNGRNPEWDIDDPETERERLLANGS